MNRTERFAVIGRYLSALRRLGSLEAGGVPLREALRVGATDLWMSSATRESSLWRDATLADQITSLTGARPGAEHRATGGSSGVVRSIVAWMRALAHSLRSTPSPVLDADVVFVQYWPTPPTESRDTSSLSNGHRSAWQSPYFGSLPDALTANGIKVGFLHLHADGPVTRPPRTVKRGVRSTSSATARHALVSDGLAVGGWVRALSTWLKIVRRWPGERELDVQITPGTDLAALWQWWRPSLRRSVLGSHGVRNALLTEMFGEVIRHNRSTRLWVIAFEGQGWESCLVRQLEAANQRWLPYLHTMMRPWDLRAHTFLSEYRVEQLAVHGRHDRTELAMHDTELVDVEALRYQHLGDALPRTSRSGVTVPTERPWLIVGGGDCELSQYELLAFLQSLRRRSVSRHLVARWHPQCSQPVGDEFIGVTFTSSPLRDLAQQVGAAFMVGRAAPLDTYLMGVPSCYLLDESGLSMSPIDDNESHRTATSSDEAVEWMLTAEQQTGPAVDVSEFFTIDAELPRWLALVNGRVT